MTESRWISGTEVLNLIRGASDKSAAHADLENALRLGTARARAGSCVISRRSGGDQIIDGKILPAKAWGRVAATYAGDTALAAPSLKLPATSKDAAVEFVAVEYEEREIRSVLSRHGLPDLPPPSKKAEPRPRSGGHNMSAHGAVISQLTIDLLGQSLKSVMDMSVNALADDLAERFKAFAPNREAIGQENRLRMARHIQTNVTEELRNRQRASIAV